MWWKTNENKNKTVQNLWDIDKVILRGKFIAIQACLKKQEKSQPNLLPKEARKRTKPKPSKRKEIIRSKAEINDIETKTTTKKNRSVKPGHGSLKRLTKLVNPYQNSF